MKKLLLVMATPFLLTACVVSPRPFTAEELDAKGSERINAFLSDQEAVTKPITLYEAMARALKYNLDYKVELMDAALRRRELDLAHFELLPDLVAGAGYAGRNNFSGASSSQLLGDRTVGPQTLVASTSAERRILTDDLTISWDVLDFGLSYVRARQKSDEVLIANERRRKVASRIIEDVRTAYWRAVSAERLIDKLAPLEAEIDDALAASRRAYRRRNAAPLTALTYQRELLGVREEIQLLHQELSVAKQQLAALMNVDPATPFELVMPNRDDSSIDVDVDPATMIEIALMLRPELREISYRQRINEKEATAALLDLLPSLRAYGGFNHDSNDFLFNSYWAGWGARASWNLVNVFRYPVRKKTVEAQQDLLDQRALALTMAVVTQVHVSATRFAIVKRRLDTQRGGHDVQSKILRQIDSGYKAGRISRQTYIREKMNGIVAEAKYDIALAELQNAFANIQASMGVDPINAEIDAEENVETLAARLQAHWERRGDRTVYGDATGTAKPVAVAELN